MERNKIETKVNDILVDILDVGYDEIKDDAVLEADFGADSIDAVEIVMELEHEFDITITDEMNLDSRTFATFMTRASMLGARVEWHNMKKSCEECKRRNAQMGHPVDDMEIERLAHEFRIWLEQ